MYLVRCKNGTKVQFLGLLLRSINLENMNSLATLSLTYFFFTLISSSILLNAFRKDLDASALYFLFSELCILMACAVIFLTNIEVLAVNPVSIGIPNFGALCAELAILFSILSTVQKIETKWFVLSVVVLGLMTVFLESIRSSNNFETIIFINILVLTGLFLTNYLVCKIKMSPLFASNPFIVLFKWFELGLVGYGLLRLIATFSSSPIIPRGTPNDLAIAVFSLYAVMASFRYMSYVGFRITWVDPDNPSQNSLNQALVKAIEEKNHLLRGLIASNRVIGISALASSLAHQLSQPLTTIAIRAETTRRELMRSRQSPLSIASLDEITAQSARLSGLVQNLRQLFGSKKNQFQAFRLQKITDEILEVIKPALESPKIALTTHYQTDSVVFGDSIQIQQVLINVLNNAIDALSKTTSEDRRISITLIEKDHQAIMRVWDSGEGIKDEVLPSLFELYFSTKENGLGVGLWLSKTIMERHRGEISGFNSPNGGAQFDIVMPLYRMQAGL